MKAPTLPFEQRLKVAQATIQARLQRVKPAKRQALRNGMWARWIQADVFNIKPLLRGVKS